MSINQLTTADKSLLWEYLHSEGQPMPDAWEPTEVEMGQALAKADEEEKGPQGLAQQAWTTLFGAADRLRNLVSGTQNAAPTSITTADIDRLRAYLLRKSQKTSSPEPAPLPPIDSASARYQQEMDGFIEWLKNADPAQVQNVALIKDPQGITRKIAFYRWKPEGSSSLEVWFEFTVNEQGELTVATEFFQQVDSAYENTVKAKNADGVIIKNRDLSLLEGYRTLKITADGPAVGTLAGLVGFHFEGGNINPVRISSDLSHPGPTQYSTPRQPLVPLKGLEKENLYYLEIGSGLILIRFDWTRQLLSWNALSPDADHEAIQFIKKGNFSAAQKRWIKSLGRPDDPPPMCRFLSAQSAKEIYAYALSGDEKLGSIRLDLFDDQTAKVTFSNGMRARKHFFTHYEDKDLDLQLITASFFGKGAISFRLIKNGQEVEYNYSRYGDGFLLIRRIYDEEADAYFLEFGFVFADNAPLIEVFENLEKNPSAIMGAIPYLKDIPFVRLTHTFPYGIRDYPSLEATDLPIVYHDLRLAVDHPKDPNSLYWQRFYNDPAAAMKAAGVAPPEEKSVPPAHLTADPSTSLGSANKLTVEWLLNLAKTEPNYPALRVMEEEPYLYIKEHGANAIYDVLVRVHKGKTEIAELSLDTPQVRQLIEQGKTLSPSRKAKSTLQELAMNVEKHAPIIQWFKSGQREISSGLVEKIAELHWVPFSDQGKTHNVQDTKKYTSTRHYEIRGFDIVAVDRGGDGKSVETVYSLEPASVSVKVSGLDIGHDGVSEGALTPRLQSNQSIKTPTTAAEFTAMVRANAPGIFYIGDIPYLFLATENPEESMFTCLMTVRKGELLLDYYDNRQGATALFTTKILELLAEEGGGGKVLRGVTATVNKLGVRPVTTFSWKDPSMPGVSLAATFAGLPENQWHLLKTSEIYLRRNGSYIEIASVQDHRTIASLSPPLKTEGPSLDPSVAVGADSGQVSAPLTADTIRRLAELQPPHPDMITVGGKPYLIFQDFERDFPVAWAVTYEGENLKITYVVKKEKIERKKSGETGNQKYSPLWTVIRKLMASQPLDEEITRKLERQLNGPNYYIVTPDGHVEWHGKDPDAVKPFDLEISGQIIITRMKGRDGSTTEIFLRTSSSVQGSSLDSGQVNGSAEATDKSKDLPPSLTQVQQADIPETGAKDIPFHLVRPEGDLKGTGLEDALIYEDAGNRGYGIIFMRTRDADGNLEHRVRTIITYRRLSHETLKTYRDVMAYVHEEFTLADDHQLILEKSQSEKYGIRDLKALSAIDASMSRGAFPPETITIDLKKRLPIRSLSQFSLKDVVDMQFDGEQYSTTDIRFVKYREIDHKMERGKVISQTFEVETANGKLKFTVNIDPKNPARSRVTFEDALGSKYPGKGLIPYEGKSHDDPNKPMTHYLLTADVSGRRMVAIWAAPDQNSNGLGRDKGWMLLDQKIISASPPKQLPAGGAKDLEFVRVHPEVFSEESGLKDYWLYENPVYGLGLAFKVTDDESGKPVGKGTFLYQKGTTEIQSAPQLTEQILFAQEHHEPKFWLSNGQIYQYAARGKKRMEFKMQPDGNLSVNILNPSITSRDSSILGGWFHLQFGSERYGSFKTGYYELVERRKEGETVYSNHVAKVDGEEINFRIYFGKRPRFVFYRSQTSGEKGFVESVLFGEPKFNSDGIAIAYTTAILDGRRIFIEFVMRREKGQTLVDPTGEVLVREIVNYREIQKSSALAELEQAVKQLNNATPKNEAGTINIQWPGKNTSTSSVSLLAHTPQIVTIQFPNATADNYRDLARKLLTDPKAPASMKVLVQWGDGGVENEYELVRENGASPRRFVLKPMTATGAPGGVVELVVKENNFTALQIEEGSELYRHLYEREKMATLNVRQEEGVVVIEGGNDGEGELLEFLRSRVSSLTPPDPLLTLRGGNSWTIRIPYDENTIAEVAAQLEQIKEVYEEYLKTNGVREIKPWNRKIEEYDLSEELQTVAGDAAEAKVTLYLRKTTEEAESYELLSAIIRGESVREIRNGYFLINGRKPGNGKISLYLGDRITIRRDTDAGWEDVEMVFDGDRLSEVKKNFVPLASKIIFRSADGPLVSDPAFSFTFIVYEDYRAETNPKPWKLKDLKIALNISLDEQKRLGLDIRGKVEIVSMPEDMRQGGEVVVRYGSLGEFRFQMGWKDEKELIITRISGPFDHQLLELDPDFGHSVIVGTVGDQIFEIPVNRMRPGRGARDYLTIPRERSAAVSAVLNLAGEPVDTTATDTDLVVEEVPQTNEDGDIIGQRIIFRGGVRNKDGSLRPKRLYLTRDEYLLVRESLDGIGIRHASINEPLVVDTTPAPFSVISDLSIRPGQVFLPTADTLNFIDSIFKNFKPRIDPSPFADGQPLEQRLEFESEDGLVISIPVRWRHRATNPFELDAAGVFAEDAPLVIDGRRIETYIKGQPQTRRPVDYNFKVYEMGGDWVFYVMVNDPTLGEYKAFNLKLTRFRFDEDPRQTPVTSSVLFDLVNALDQPDPSRPIERLDENEAQYRRSARLELDERIVQTFGNQTDREHLSQVFHLAQIRVEHAGDAVWLAFVTPDKSDGNTVAELTGLGLDRSSYGIDFDETLTLQMRTVGDDAVVHETINLEPSWSAQNRTIRLREIKPDGSYGRMFVWSLPLQTLSEEQYDPNQPIERVDEVKSRWAALNAILIRNRNLPVITDADFKRAQKAQEEVIKDLLGATLNFGDIQLPAIPEEHTGFVVPPNHEIEPITDEARALELLSHYPLHDQLFLPDEATVFLQSFIGRPREMMTFVTHHGVILQVPEEIRPVHPYDYIFDETADPVTGVRGARLLFPNPERNNKIYPSLINRPYEGIDDLLSVYPGVELSGRVYQGEAVKKFRENYNLTAGVGVKGEGTIILPTGSGKSLVAAQAMAVVLMEALLRGGYRDGDKFILTTHLPDNIPHLTRDIQKYFGPIFRQITGRELTISAVAGSGPGSEDFLGDLVILGIQKTGAKSYDLEGKLATALNQTDPDPAKRRQVVLRVTDEIHHHEADIWQRVNDSLTRVTPEAYVLGLTATPDGTEPNILYSEKSLNLMRQGILPNVHVAEISTGVHLDRIVARGKNGNGDFSANALTPILNTAARNRLVIESLEKLGYQQEGNRFALAHTRIVGARVDHAIALGEEYVRHFGQGLGRSERYLAYYKEQYPLRARRIELLKPTLDAANEVTKNLSEADIEAVVEKKNRGEIDAIVLVAVGEKLSPKVRELIEKYRKDGTIEAVVTVDLWIEGADEYYTQNLIYAGATKSAERMGQLGGRLTRRGPDEVDYSTGRLLYYRPRLALCFRDIYNTAGDPAKGYLQTFAGAYGYSGGVPDGKRWDMLTGREARNEPAYFEFPRKLLHAKRLSGKNNDRLEMQIGPKEEARHLVLEEFGTEKIFSERKVYGFRSKQAGKKSKINGEAVAELQEFIRYLNLEDQPHITGEVGKNLFPDGKKKIHLSNGSILEMDIVRDGDIHERKYRLNGIQIPSNGGEERPKAYLHYTDAAGQTQSFDVFSSQQTSSLLYLRDQESKQFYYAFVDRDGRFLMWRRRPYTRDYHRHGSSVDFTMTNREGENYKSEAHSYASRKPVLLPGEEELKFEVTAVLARWENASQRAPEETSLTEHAKVRFIVGVDENDELSIQLGMATEAEKKNKAYFPQEAAPGTMVQIHEDKWIDERTGGEHRGRVRIVFSRPTPSADGSRVAPYGYLEFENREHLIGAATNFNLLRAHYHERWAWFASKLMLNAADFLIKGAGLMVDPTKFSLFSEDLIEDIVGKDIAQEIFAKLSHVKDASAADLPLLLGVLSMLSQYDYYGESTPDKPFLTPAGRYADQVVAELASFAKSLRPAPTDSGTNEPKGSDVVIARSPPQADDEAIFSGKAGGDGVIARNEATKQSSEVHTSLPIGLLRYARNDTLSGARDDTPHLSTNTFPLTMSETIDIPTSDSAASLFHIIGASEVIAEEPVFTIVGAHEEESAMPGAVLAEPDSASESLVHSAGLFGVTGAGSPLKSSAMPLALRVMR